MARILVVTWAGGGNVPPAITLATKLAQRGHEVRAIGTGSLAPRFESDGIPFVARELLAEWDPAALARDVLAEARKTDLVVCAYMLPAGLSARRGLHRTDFNLPKGVMHPPLGWLSCRCMEPPANLRHTLRSTRKIHHV